VRTRYIIPTTMGIIDPTAEWRPLSEHYHRMSDNELLVLARQNSELTDAAQALTSSWFLALVSRRLRGVAPSPCLQHVVTSITLKPPLESDLDLLRAG
jgi:hypothetical protein